MGIFTLAESSIRSLFLSLKSAQKEYLQLVTTLLEMVKFILITGIMDDSFVEVQSAVHKRNCKDGAYWAIYYFYNLISLLVFCLHLS